MKTQSGFPFFICYLLFTVALLQNCATLWGITHSTRAAYHCPASYDTTIAPSERFSPMFVGVKLHFNPRGNVGILTFIDLPLSLALDTLLLPITLPVTVLYYWMDIDGKREELRKRGSCR
ncbi:YceK/YidQ family lipoprotein [Leptospira gomenensis]|uniref:YceK/YidQ family lipoprotein n=1 Tax=Leptospira gomenensis TaxID=2484974 RepID=A0A5F1YD63_9LEPT|nr:YceK/YidQ family lipoprotein [Leptospira gomenensis]TGK35987.1 YceK/YidQ family lipoprotein [Leptospira gomenensis]TGK39982.1 YceK/YidQ family lipoprotein [Leptospira gomenensis]TGK51431.1 YceK/YidQ family lipoprotein [Leptospira gomenensis]TGK64894.1 YceK/YidQ family lipoprotein [Leptospira gomenensis]